ncbi:MAG: hypothetical protein JKZ00_05475 [Flavobacteriaceae bacterium]|nr:hypothetical protein [Flavobacteriaceae bacterium]
MKYLLLFIGLMCFISCTNPSIEFQTQQETNIEVWNMQRQYIANSGAIFKNGDIVWTFNYDSSILTIENNIPNAWFDAGMYRFQTTKDSLFIDFINLQYDFKIVVQDSIYWILADPLPYVMDDELAFTFLIEE